MGQDPGGDGRGVRGIGNEGGRRVHAAHLGHPSPLAEVAPCSRGVSLLLEVRKKYEKGFDRCRAEKEEGVLERHGRPSWAGLGLLPSAPSSASASPSQPRRAVASGNVLEGRGVFLWPTDRRTDAAEGMGNASQTGFREAAGLCHAGGVCQELRRLSRTRLTNGALFISILRKRTCTVGGRPSGVRPPPCDVSRCRHCPGDLVPGQRAGLPLPLSLFPSSSRSSELCSQNRQGGGEADGQLSRSG